MINSCEQLKAKHDIRDYMYWNVLLAVPIVTACFAIFQHSRFWFSVYIILALILIMLILRHYCSHCPHYVQNKKTLNCMFFWGIPKVFKPRPGSLSTLDTAISFIAPCILLLFPFYWLLLEPYFLVIYLLSLVGFVATIRRNECGRCIYFECPVNKVPKSLKKKQVE